jgi:hypothetical protein
MRGLLAIAALAALACAPPEEGPLHRPGEDCLACHTDADTSPQPGAPRWTAAGTLYVDPLAAADRGFFGATVTLTDQAGKVVAMRTGGTGNFFTAEALQFPVQVEVQAGGVVARMADAPSGACNGCHAVPPSGSAPGRIFVRSE